MSKPILHAEFLKAYAQGQVVEWMPTDPSRNQTWREVETTFSIGLFNRTDFKFRIKPRTILINGIEVPAGETKKLSKGTPYFYANIYDAKNRAHKKYWSGDDFDMQMLHQGFVQLALPNAAIHARALLSFTKIKGE